MGTFTLGPHLPGANMLPNGSFENDVFPGSIGNYALVVTKSGVIETGWAAHGTKSARFTGNSDGTVPEQGGYGHYIGCEFGSAAAVPGERYTFSYTMNMLDLPFPEVAVGLAARVLFLGAGGAHIEFLDLWSPALTGVYRHSVSAVAPVGTVFVAPAFYCFVSGTYDFYLDALMLNRGTNTEYKDGSSSGWSWAGTANNSISAPTPALQGGGVALSGAPPYVLSEADSAAAREQWVRPGLLSQTA